MAEVRPSPPAARPDLLLPVSHASAAQMCAAAAQMCAARGQEQPSPLPLPLLGADPPPQAPATSAVQNQETGSLQLLVERVCKSN